MAAVKRPIVDARGLLCPLPVIRLQEAVKHFPPNTYVELIGTDPGVLYDIPAWCRVNGHQVIKTWHQDDEYHILVVIGP